MLESDSRKQQEKTFICNHCQFGFCHNRSLKRHIKEKHHVKEEKEETFKCNYCRISYYHGRSLIRHVNEKHIMKKEERIELTIVYSNIVECIHFDKSFNDMYESTPAPWPIKPTRPMRPLELLMDSLLIFQSCAYEAIASCYYKDLCEPPSWEDLKEHCPQVITTYINEYLINNINLKHKKNIQEWKDLLDQTVEHMISQLQKWECYSGRYLEL
jgi:hypothetical protein